MGCKWYETKTTHYYYVFMELLASRQTITTLTLNEIEELFFKTYSSPLLKKTRFAYSIIPDNSKTILSNVFNCLNINNELNVFNCLNIIKILYFDRYVRKSFSKQRTYDSSWS